jgi:hypothetical protein
VEPALGSGEHHEDVGARRLPRFCETRPNLSLFLLSAATLYLELLLIRWIGTEIRLFAYLQNSILVVCFLGMGLGCITSRQRVSTHGLLYPLAILVAALCVPQIRGALNRVGERLGAAGDLLIWNHLNGGDGLETAWYLVQGLAMSYLLMYLVCCAFVPLGRLIGRQIDEHPRTISAYSLNIVGSLAGIWLFAAFSAFGASPFVWVIVLAALLMFFPDPAPRRWVGHALVLLAVVVVSGWGDAQPGAMEVHWSPYQKLVLRRPRADESAPGSYVIEVNNVGYQGIVDTRAAPPDRVAVTRGGLPPALFSLGQYDLPTLVHPDPRRVLLVGTGAGNDAAGALRGGAQRVTAVEIDPAIVELGRRYHPQKPYSSDRVDVVVDDARAFFARSTQQYDVISFGLLDAHTQTTLTNGRLDHFVYTRESIRRARELLAEGGVMLLSFEPQRPFIADRIARTLHEAFGEKPLIFRMPHTVVGWGGVMFIAGDLGAVRRQMDQVPQLRDYVQECVRRHPVSLAEVTPVTTDDWPYLYLKEPSIPILFFLLAGLLVLLLLHVRRSHKATTASVRWRREHLHFFCLGAGFILLEVHNISRSAVVLGTSWFVNAVVISGVLVMILVANAVQARGPRFPTAWAYAVLGATCVALYVFDLSALSELAYSWRIVSVGLLTAVPIAFSGIIFVRSFEAADAKDQALGANLLGSVLGSVLQAFTFIFGLKFLLLVVIAAYAGAALTQTRRTILKSPYEAA